MKLNVKTISIFGLLGLFLFSIMFCCCFTKIAKAEEHKPSCHQTQSKDDSSDHDVNECDCDDSLAVIQTGESFSHTVHLLAYLNFDQHMADLKPVEYEALAYQAPPDYFNTIPLYIKHSILRL